jgi:hypothetical protein
LWVLGVRRILVARIFAAYATPDKKNSKCRSSFHFFPRFLCFVFFFFFFKGFFLFFVFDCFFFWSFFSFLLCCRILLGGSLLNLELPTNCCDINLVPRPLHLRRHACASSSSCLVSLKVRAVVLSRLPCTAAQHPLVSLCIPFRCLDQILSGTPR